MSKILFSRPKGASPGDAGAKKIRRKTLFSKLRKIFASIGLMFKELPKPVKYFDKSKLKANMETKLPWMRDSSLDCDILLLKYIFKMYKNVLLLYLFSFEICQSIV